MSSKVQKKDTMVVNIKAPYVNNFQYLPNRFNFTATDGTLVDTIIIPPNDNVITGPFNSVADVHISSDGNDGQLENVYLLQRHNKVTMQVILKERIGKLPNFLPIPCLLVGDFSSISTMADYDEFVIKPTDGARGLATFHFKRDKYTLMYLFTRLKKDGIKKLADEKIITMLHCSEHSDNESMTFAENNDTLHDFTIQPVIKKKLEFRVLTDYSGYPFYAQKRAMYGDVVPAATGDDLGDSGFISHLSDYSLTTNLTNSQVNESLIKNIMDGFKLLDIPFNSFDLFITEDDQWGFFEFSNQWYVGDMCEKITTNMLLDFMKNLYHTKVKDKKKERPTINNM